ncbi:PREDICTED: uncharacterized protein LOC108760014 [Trachymyrmex cornetzi]|uniref:uncharacterized protein LOC108760014 n=1 Tax=Trachymyrmex cornetzi TaxID=471704 RepID=UPI00084F3702|nr:PREDICTED: uncharacterized protein LOC108760014 [Trachymyrmex cornetzi]
MTNDNNLSFVTHIRNIVIPELSDFLHNSLGLNSHDIKINSMLKFTTNWCKNNDDIIFTRADKGNSTVALDRSYYNDKIQELLNDTETYTLVKKNPALNLEKSLNNLLKKWHQKNYINNSQLWCLRSSDSLLPKAYALPKIHKEGIPFRIIVSSVNTALYQLASFLQDIISKSIPSARSKVKNSFDLFKRLNGFQIDETECLISLDVVSLFTNIPIELAIEGIERRWNSIGCSTNIPKKEFLEAIKFVLTSTYFSFNNTIYKQTFGTPMGSPLSPILADIVMEDLEVRALKLLQLEDLIYFRYVDDSFMIASKDKISKIVKVFNEQHMRLKFTVEREVNHELCFLDLLIVNKDNKIVIDWYHKKTFSGRYLSFYSNHPTCHKIGMIFSLVDRAISLSDPIYYSKNLEFVIEVLLDNGYPLDFIFKNINNRIRTLAHKDVICDKTNDDKELRQLMVIPYVNSISNKVSKSINKANYMIGYRCLNKLNRFIKVQKDKNEQENNNNVIYKIDCKNCEASYVGQTKRQLKTRIKEHKNNFKLDQSKHSVITNHMNENNHEFNWDAVNILDFESNYRKRNISEMIHIKEQKKGLNLMKDTELLDKSYSNIIFDIRDKKL